jgi:hypothetical protein
MSTVVYVVTFIYAATNISQAASSTRWPSAPGRVALALDSRQISDPGGPSRIWYEYKVGGQTYRSDRVNFFEAGAIQKYKEGQIVEVFYNALTPAEACLVPGVSLMGWVNLSVAAIIMIFGGVAALSLFFSWLRNDNKASPKTALFWFLAAMID